VSGRKGRRRGGRMSGLSVQRRLQLAAGSWQQRAAQRLCRKDDSRSSSQAQQASSVIEETKKTSDVWPHQHRLARHRRADRLAGRHREEQIRSARRVRSARAPRGPRGGSRRRYPMELVDVRASSSRSAESSRRAECRLRDDMAARGSSGPASAADYTSLGVADTTFEDSCRGLFRS